MTEVEPPSTVPGQFDAVVAVRGAATTFLAALRIGALTTVVSTLCTPRELAHILRHSDTQFFVALRRFLTHDYATTLEAAFPALGGCDPGELHTVDAPYLRAVWLDDPTDCHWARSVDDLLAAVERQVFPSDEAVVVYTSGSTSQPKAVVHTQWNVTRHPSSEHSYF
jgi:acyl-coenzyme A synthetase/AMP-(fatty) acid ligase